MDNISLALKSAADVRYDLLRFTAIDRGKRKMVLFLEFLLNLAVIHR